MIIVLFSESFAVGKAARRTTSGTFDLPDPWNSALLFEHHSSLLSVWYKIKGVNRGVTSNEHDIVDISLVNLGVLENLVDGLDGVGEELGVEGLELGLGEGGDEVEVLHEVVDLDLERKKGGQNMLQNAASGDQARLLAHIVVHVYFPHVGHDTVVTTRFLEQVYDSSNHRNSRVCGLGKVGCANLGGVVGRQHALGTFTGSTETTHGTGILGRILLVLLLDLSDEVVTDVGIEILTTEAGVTTGGTDLKDIVVHLEEGSIEGTTTEIEDKDLSKRKSQESQNTGYSIMICLSRVSVIAI